MTNYNSPELGEWSLLAGCLERVNIAPGLLESARNHQFPAEEPTTNSSADQARMIREAQRPLAMRDTTAQELYAMAQNQGQADLARVLGQSETGRVGAHPTEPPELNRDAIGNEATLLAKPAGETRQELTKVP